jgi:hypothetical protein
MKKFGFCLITIVAYTLLMANSSCQQKKNVFMKNNTMEVLFFPGLINTNIPISCMDMERNLSAEYDDTIFLEHVDFEKIQNALLQSKLQNDTLHITCDARILVKMDSMAFCIGEQGCFCNEDDSNLQIDSSVRYLIKCKSTYYNYIDVEDIYDDNDVKRFGIPIDYEENNYIGKPKELVHVLIVDQTRCCN